MKAIMTSAVLLLLAADGYAGQRSKSEQAAVCQATFSNCVDSCTPDDEPPSCRRLEKECRKGKHGNKRRCHELEDACSAERRELRDAMRACLKSCREGLWECTPSQGCAPHHGHGHHGHGHHECDNSADPAAIDACVTESTECVSDCQHQTEQCLEEATSRVGEWLGSIKDLFGFCVAQAGDNYQMVVQCLGELPETNLSCIQANATCFKTCSKEMGACLSRATKP